MIEQDYIEYQKNRCKRCIKNALKTGKIEQLQEAADIKKEMIGYISGLREAADIIKNFPFPKEQIESEIEKAKESIIELFENI